jgi:serine/threonine-protein kinase
LAINCPKCDSDHTDNARFCSNCPTPLETSKDIEVTKTLETSIEHLTTGSTLASRYQIIEELGKGGIGIVYKVHDSEIKENVVLKFLKPELEE